MFEDTPAPRVFALPPGVDFPRALVEGLRARMAGQPPEAMARVELIVNTRRMARRIRELFDAGPPVLLPRLRLVAEIADQPVLAGLPEPAPPLRRRLELAQLIGELLYRQPDLAARASVYDLADSLAGLMAEMHGEDVPAAAIRALDVSDMSGHWARAQAFIDIADRFAVAGGAAPDEEARLRLAVATLARLWADAPPTHPVIVAGSTGSRGTTALLMRLVAALPHGALVLPGFDFDLPEPVWHYLGDPMRGEDHPQFRFRHLLEALSLTPRDVRPWTGAQAPGPARNQVVSLALRPAPVTDAWLSEGPALPDLTEAMAGVTLLEAENPRMEAQTIALRLREAAETGQSAALITPDRMLTRQVTAALDRWGILPDDSAGQPLHLSPPGRLLRHVAELFVARLTGEALLTILKHPLCHSGAGRGAHLRNSRELELHLREKGPPFPDAESLGRAQAAAKIPAPWVAWVAACFAGQPVAGPLPLAEWVARLHRLIEAVSTGSDPSAGSGGLWQQNAGIEALSVMRELAAQADAGGAMTAREFADLIGALLASREVRDRDAPSGGIMIWGTLEARVQGAELLILGGLNEGSWPEAAPADPWLNRALRQQAGLLLPERRIGLSAHDFQQAVAAPEVWLTRALRSEDAETVPSRWLNRLSNLLAGLPERGGSDALERMKGAAAPWKRLAGALDAAPRAPQAPQAPRPSPCPPVAARPRRLAVTDIKRLVRDPYSVYVRRILKLRPLGALLQAPDALLRGIVVHQILERFVQHAPLAAMADPGARFRELIRETLDQEVPWPLARRLWAARLERIEEWFLEGEAARQSQARPTHFEVSGERRIAPLDFTLTCKADRIDLTDRGTALIYDYKTGAPPTRPQQARFDKQLLLEAAIAEAGGFERLGAVTVEAAAFIGLGTNPKLVEAPLDETPAEQVWQDFTALMGAYLSRDQGFTARRALFRDSEVGDYDHLARFGEWDRATASTPQVLK